MTKQSDKKELEEEIKKRISCPQKEMITPNLNPHMMHDIVEEVETSEEYKMAMHNYKQALKKEDRNSRKELLNKAMDQLKQSEEYKQKKDTATALENSIQNALK